jgi:hypothetical protein
MTCMCAFAQSTAMATTQLTRVVQCRAIQHNDAASWQSHNNREKKLRMSWVVVTDNDGRRQLQIHWEPATGELAARLGPQL